MRSLVLTFEDLLRRTDTAERMRKILQILEQKYNSPVDLEFTLKINNPNSVKPQVCLTILQCRPQSYLVTGEQVPLPVNLPKQDIIFATRFVVPEGLIPESIMLSTCLPKDILRFPHRIARYLLVRAISRLNNAMKDEKFICVGPGRWGSSNSDLGVSVDYGDIYNTEALVELSRKRHWPCS